MEDITDADYMHAKRVCKDFEIKSLVEYHDLYLQSDTLFLVYVFKTSKKMCLNIYHLGLVKFLPAPGLVWQTALEKTEVKLETNFITQSCFVVPENIRLNSTHYCVIKSFNKRKLQQIAFNRSLDIDLQVYMKLRKRCTAKPYSFLYIDTTLASLNKIILHVSERIF